MKKFSVEAGVGIFLIFGVLCLAYLSVKLGDIDLFSQEQYAVKAYFTNVSGLKENATIEVAGVRIGKVSKIYLNEYDAEVNLLIDNDIKLPEDSIASIRTQGIIGDKFIKISPGGAEEYIETGGEILETESAIDIEELVSKYIFEGE